MLFAMILRIAQLQSHRTLHSACFKQGYVLGDLVRNDFPGFPSGNIGDMLRDFREPMTFDEDLIIQERGPSMDSSRIRNAI